MKSPLTSLIKHFLVVCPHGLGPNLLKTTIESINFPVKKNVAQCGTLFSALPRSRSSKVFSLPAVCGDDQDIDLEESPFLGNGILIRCPDEGELEIASSLTGLPPLYLYQDDYCSVISNNIESISKLPCCSLHFDIQAVVELARIGNPINYRTLFKEIRIIPAGSLVSINNKSVRVKENIWQPQKASQFQGIDSYLEEMATTMQTSIRRMDLRKSFLSLTAGLDTRAIIATLLMQDKLIPSFTISGSRPTLDAMRAWQLCEAYGIPHTTVEVDSTLNEKLPGYSVSASLYSGGLLSFEQASELYFYDTAGPDYLGRLSGNLGNQVGRSGTEGTSTRRAPTTSLAPDIRNQPGSFSGDGHWFFEVNREADLLSPQFIIPREYLFRAAGNYSIGHEHVIQQTPYADRTLIDIKYREPSFSRGKPNSIKGIKLRDLKHRFIGQSSKKSFQCRVIKKSGGFSAACPINWGWKVDGGFSPGGLFYGARAFSDIMIGNKLNSVPGANKLLRVSGIKGFSGFHTRQGLYTSSMQNFIKDLFHKKTVLDSGLFEKNRLEYLCCDGLKDESNYDEIVLTLDLALATENFGAAL